MLHLYGTRGDAKIWGKNNFRAYEEVQHAEVSVAEGRREGQKRTPSEQTSRGVNANENDLKSGGRINIKLNTQGYFVSLWRGNVLIYVARETISL